MLCPLYSATISLGVNGLPVYIIFDCNVKVKPSVLSLISRGIIAKGTVIKLFCK